MNQTVAIVRTMGLNEPLFITIPKEPAETLNHNSWLQTQSYYFIPKLDFRQDPIDAFTAICPHNSGLHIFAEIGLSQTFFDSVQLSWNPEVLQVTAQKVCGLVKCITIEAKNAPLFTQGYLSSLS